MRSLYGAIHPVWISLLSLAFFSFSLIKAQQPNDPQQWENTAGIKLLLQATPDLVQSGMPADLVVILFISEQDPLNTFAGRISFVLDQFEYNMTIVDKRVYMTRTDIYSLQIDENRCLLQNEVPSDIVANAFSSLTVVDGAPNDIYNCTNTTKRIQITIANMPYLVCPRLKSRINTMRSLYGAIHPVWISLLSLAFFSFSLIKAQQPNDPQQWENTAGIKLLLQATPDLVQSGMPADLVVILFISEQDPLNTFAGRISFVLDQFEYNMTIVDKRVYMTRTDIYSLQIDENRCLLQNEVPSDIVANAFSSLTVVDGAPNDIYNCTNTTKRIQITIANMPYLVCPSPNVISVDPQNTTLASKIAFLRAHGDTVMAGSDLASPQNMSSTECLPIPNLSLDYVDPNFEQEIVQSYDKNGCQCPEKRLPCLFVHGIGVREDQEPDGPFYYWKGTTLEDHCCSTIRFVHSDSETRAWHDETLAQRYCEAALGMAPSTNTTTIENIVIVSHSAGNLVVANAETLNICKLGQTAKWIALAAPMRGSFLADEAESICSGTTTAYKKITYSISRAFDKQQRCPLPPSKISLVSKESKYSNPELDELYEKAEGVYMAKASSILCGASHVGLMTTRAAKYTFLSILTTSVTEKTDGSVSFSSCRAGYRVEDFKTTWKNTRHYLARLNHGDSKLVGIKDGWWGDDRKPIKWFKCQF
ncbi:hypothetical protein ABG067_006463 [Albugo candida]